MNIDNYPIRHWKASFYRDIKKKWIHGDFFLTSKYICFRNTSSDSNEPCQIIIMFDDFNQIMKAKSLFIFDCIVVTVDKTQFWFSSFLNRDAVYNFLTHFWKERLFTVPNKNCAPKCVQSYSKTHIGKNLLHISADCEKTLASAAIQLESQGSQLKNAYANMFDLDNDLEVAETLISGLEKWMGMWNLSNKVSELEPFEIVQNSTKVLVHEIPVIFTSHVYCSDVLHVSGTLSASADGISIHDEKQTLIQHYPMKHVSSMRMVSPYELMIAKHLIGKPDVAYTIVSTKMTDFIQNIEPIYRRIIDYDDSLSEQPSTLDTIKKFTSSEVKFDVSVPGSLELNEVKSLKISKPENDNIQQVLLKDKSGKSISLNEAQQLTESIARMKNMAVDIGVEQESQLELIENLTDRVESSDSRIQSATKRIIKMK